MPNHILVEHLVPNIYSKISNELVIFCILTPYYISWILQLIAEFGDEAMHRINQYVLFDMMGEGAASQVFRAKHTRTKEDFAIKMMKKSSGRSNLRRTKVDMPKREIAILKKLDHPNIVKLVEVIDDVNDDKVYLVLEYVKHGSVLSGDTKTKPLGEEKARNYFRDIISGVEYLHHNHIAHRDIKPENLLLSEDGKIKIADFGVSVLFDSENDMTNASAGTAAFMAPEMCQKDNQKYSARMTDIWAMGVTLFAFIYGHLPFVAESAFQVYQDIVEKEISFLPSTTDQKGKVVKVSEGLLDLLKGLLTKSPTQRLRMESIRSHPWVTKNGKMPLEQLHEEDKVAVKDSEVLESVSNIRRMINLKTIMHKRKMEARRTLEIRRASLSSQQAFVSRKSVVQSRTEVDESPSTPGTVPETDDNVPAIMLRASTFTKRAAGTEDSSNGLCFRTHGFFVHTYNLTIYAEYLLHTETKEDSTF